MERKPIHFILIERYKKGGVKGQSKKYLIYLRVERREMRWEMKVLILHRYIAYI